MALSWHYYCKGNTVFVMKIICKVYANTRRNIIFK
jgi:hypothetical protein